MIYLLKKEVPEKNFEVYRQFLYNRCDIATFNIPYFSWEVNSPKPEKFKAEFQEYLDDNIKDLLDDLQPFIRQDYFSNHYFGSERSYMMRIIVVELTEESSFVLPQESIYELEYPNTFEDLCLFSKGKCFLKSVAHEDLCWLYPTFISEVEYMKSLGMKLKLLYDCDTDFTLDYRITFKSK